LSNGVASGSRSRLFTTAIDRSAAPSLPIQRAHKKRAADMLFIGSIISARTPLSQLSVPSSSASIRRE
jgi:hypothetical protein